MSYHNNRESVANIYVGLMERGWKCYGYRADESDSMTDYYSPASWDGIAEKNGYVLLVDVYGTSQSGYKKTKSMYTPDWSKIEKLQATINDKAATPNEKESCQNLIDNMKKKESESTVVIEHYPTFKNGNPKRNNWHIEKDGVIIAKGNGAFQCDGYLFHSYKEETMKKVNAFIDKIESKIKGNEKLVPVIEKVVKTVTKPVEVTNIKTLQVGDILSFDYHGHYWMVYAVSEKTFSYELLGSEKRGYQRTKNGKRYYDYMTKFNANLENGKIKLYTLQEVEEVTEKTVFKKAYRDNSQKENLLHGETVEASEVNEEVAATVETTQETNSAENTITYQTGTGTKGNGIEINFPSKPSEETRKAMKEADFRWGGKNRPSIWWAINTEESLQLAKMLVGEAVTTENTYNSDLAEEPKESTKTEEIEKEYPFIKGIAFQYGAEAFKKGIIRVPAMDKQFNEDLFTGVPVGEPSTIKYMKEWFQGWDSENLKPEENVYNNEVLETPSGYYCHFKEWDLEFDQIKELLNNFNIPFEEAGNKFIFEGLTPHQFEMVQMINQENNSILFDDNYRHEELINSLTDSANEYIAEMENNKVNFDLQYFSTATLEKPEGVGTMGSILDKFNDINIENDTRITEVDRKHCENQELMYKEAVHAMQQTLELFKGLFEKNKSNNSDTEYRSGYIFKFEDINHIEDRIEKIKSCFISNIICYFEKAYNVTLKDPELKKKYDTSVTYNDIVDEVFEQLGGFNFEEKAINELITKCNDTIYSGDKITIKKNKLSIQDFVWWDSYSWVGHRIGYSEKKVNPLFAGLSHFETGSTETLAYYKSIHKELSEGEKTYDIFSKYELGYNKIQSIKFFKNGKIEIEFQSMQQAQQFKNIYLKCNR